MTAPLMLHESDLPEAGRFLVVGDIHGHSELLERLLRLCDFSARDRLICCGDLIDRGPKSYEVLLQFQTHDHFHSLMGNHEAMMIAALRDEGLRDIWRREGEIWADALSDADLASCLSYVESLPLTGELLLRDGRRVGLVHAEVPAGMHWDGVGDVRLQARDLLDVGASTDASRLMWGRSVFNLMRHAPHVESRHHAAAFEVPGVDLVLAGHSVTPSREPIRAGKYLWVDTGSFWTPQWVNRWKGALPGRLTAVDPSAGIYWQVGHGRMDRWGPLALPARVLA